MVSNDKAITMKLPADLYERLKEEAANNMISVSALIRMACVKYLADANSEK